MVFAEDLAERKALLLAGCDAVVVMVGGLGTLDEATEILELRKHGFHDKPVVLLNTAGFYDGLALQLRRMDADGFLPIPSAELGPRRRRRGEGARLPRGVRRAVTRDVRVRYRRAVHLEELQWFVALAETEHVTDAAAELRSQPADAVARLGAFRGAGRDATVRPGQSATSAQRLRADHARARRRSIAEMQSAGERIAALRDPDSGRVRLAFLHSLASWYVPGTTSTFPRYRAWNRFRPVPRSGARDHRSSAWRSSRPGDHLPAPRRARLRLASAVRRTPLPGRPARASAGRADPDAAVRRGGRAVRRADRAVRTATAHRRPMRRRRPRPRTSCSRPPRFPRWRGWWRPDSVSPWFPSHVRAPANPRRCTFRWRTLGPSAKWDWCGTEIGRYPHPPNALRTF